MSKEITKINGLGEVELRIAWPDYQTKECKEVEIVTAELTEVNQDFNNDDFLHSSSTLTLVGWNRDNERVTITIKNYQASAHDKRDYIKHDIIETNREINEERMIE